MTRLYAQPYDISAHGFYFETLSEYEKKSSVNFNQCGLLVEEYEIQFIEGEPIDSRLFDALEIHQGDIHHFLEACDLWNDHEKQKVIIAVGECGYKFDFATGNPNDFDVDIYEYSNIKELAEYFVDEGLFGEIPDRLQGYLDYDAIARDLSFDYNEIVIAETPLIYRCF